MYSIKKKIWTEVQLCLVTAS